MADLVTIDYTQEGQEKLLNQFQEKPVVKALIGAYLDSLKETQEDTLYLLNNRSIDTAEGIFLDQIGKTVGAKREGAPDEEYRDMIRLSILINNSEGTPPQVARIIKAYTEASNIRIFEHFPGNVYFAVDGKARLDRVYSLVQKIMPACVNEAPIAVNDNPGAEEGDFGFVTSEIALTEFNLVPLLDNSGNNIVDDNGDDILVTASTGKYSQDAILEEEPAFGGGEGKPFAELYDKNR